MYFYNVVWGEYEDRSEWVVCHDKKLTMLQVGNLLKDTWNNMDQNVEYPIHACFREAGFTDLVVVGTVYLSDAYCDEPKQVFESDLDRLIEEEKQQSFWEEVEKQ